MRIYLFYFFVVFFIISVFYFSWIESPRLSLNGTLPEFISRWADHNENENMRTAVPFVFLSILIGIRLMYVRAGLSWWLTSWIVLTCVVILAEVGQLFLPLRRFDWRDIFWAVFPSLIILFILYSIKKKEV